MATSVPPPVFGPTGFTVPASSDILAGVQADLNAAFGGNLNPGLTTSQGQLATSFASIIGNVNDLFTYYTNQVDPALASGRMQDAIGRIYFIERLPSQPTVLQVLCTGLQGAIIPIGALINDGSNNVYAATNLGVIGNSGTVQVSFAAVLAGPIPVPVSIAIYQAIPGWNTIALISGVVGQNVETPQAFELRRQASVAQNASGSLPSILGAVLAIPGVLDAYVTENTTNGTLTIQGAVLLPHSLYVAVYGGSAAAVAQAIWSKKAPGCNYNGNTTVVVTDTNSGYSPPLPTYNVTFQIPPPLPIIFIVNLVQNALVPSNVVALVQAAIMSAFAGGDGGPRVRIGSTIYASRFYAPVVALGSGAGNWVQIRSILIGSPNTPSAVFTGSIGGSAGSTNVLTVTALTSGALGANQTLTDGTAGLIVIGTQILAQLSGSAGGTGTYTVSSSQTVPSEVFTTVVANLTSVLVNINQEPVISAADIYVNTS